MDHTNSGHKQIHCLNCSSILGRKKKGKIKYNLYGGGSLLPLLPHFVSYKMAWCPRDSWSQKLVCLQIPIAKKGKFKEGAQNESSIFAYWYLNQVFFMLLLKVKTPFHRKLKLLGTLLENCHCISVGDLLERTLSYINGDHIRKKTRFIVVKTKEIHRLPSNVLVSLFNRFSSIRCWKNSISLPQLLSKNCSSSVFHQKNENKHTTK